MAPSSYQPPTRGDKAALTTRSQSVETNLSHTQTTVAKLMEAEGIYLSEEERTADSIAAQWSGITDMSNAVEHQQGNDHVMKMVQKAMAAKGGKWDYASLAEFLYKPKAWMKGTKMAFAGLKKASDRAAIIAYLRAQDDTPEALPE